MSGKVVHFEIPFEDGDRARSFYGDVFGWELMHMPDMGYTMVTTGPTDPGAGPTESGFINGGMLERDADFTGPNLVLETDQIEESLAAVTAAGGIVVRERMPVGDMGFAAYFRDTEGNLVGLWENAPES
jgi:predicted enzyme related to lactoylglutathione lyase